MNVYLDTSVILSRLLNQNNALENWGNWRGCYTSMLTKLEFLRTVDRLRLKGILTDRQRVILQNEFSEVWKVCHHLGLSQDILDLASLPMPTVLGTLDSIHLTSATQLIASQKIDLTFLTHDQQLATAAMAMGLSVDGVVC